MRTFLTLAVLAASAPMAQAQVLQAPARSQQGQFGNRVLSERPASTLALEANLLGGHDGNIDTFSTGSTPIVYPFSGYLATLSSALRFTRTSRRHSFTVGGRGYFNSYQTSPSQKGGEVSVEGLTTVRRSTQLTGQFLGANEPSFLIGPRGAIGSGTTTVTAGGGIDPGGTSGVTSQRTHHLSGEGGLRRIWTLRHSTNLGATAWRAEPTGSLGLANRQYGLNVRQAWNVSRSVSLWGGYQWADERTRDLTRFSSGVTLTAHTASGGLSILRRLSPRRTVSLDVSSGAMVVETLTVGAAPSVTANLTEPVAQATLRVDVGRSWAWSADVRRSVTLLTGLSAQPFSSETAFVSLGGSLGSRASMVVSASSAQGRAVDGGDGQFSSLAGMVQSAIRINQRLSAVANYTYYRHNLGRGVSVPTGFPTRFDLSTVRFGLTLRLPLMQPRQERR